MSEKRVLHVELSNLRQSLAQFASAWQKAEAGEPVETFEGIGFGTMEQFLSVFTPRRWALVRELKAAGPLSIYALAKRVGRNYKNVHVDVATLMEWKVVEKDQAGRVFVPYDEIDVRLPLLLEAA